ncbi:MAG: phosphodiester glycosidase family protein [Anaerolineales bacterium]
MTRARSAHGDWVEQNGRYVYLVVVDGRQPFYSAGITFADLAQLLIDHGVYTAMSLDGGVVVHAGG